MNHRTPLAACLRLVELVYKWQKGRQTPEDWRATLMAHVASIRTAAEEESELLRRAARLLAAGQQGKPVYYDHESLRSFLEEVEHFLGEEKS